MRARLAKTLRYVISQRLVPRKDGGRVAVVEVFKNTPTSNYLECEDSSGGTVLEALKNGASEGMQHFDAEIEKLVRAEIDRPGNGVELRHRCGPTAAFSEYPELLVETYLLGLGYGI